LGDKFEEEEKEVDQAVDTLNAKSGGNWLLKRVWWEKTEDVYEQIKEVFNHVMDTRMQFISERNKLDRELDIFYGEMGIEQGPLHDVLSHAQDLMDKDKKEQGYLNKKEQAFVKKLSGKDRELEQLKLDVKAIQELDNKIDEALDTLFKQIDVCNQYEQKAWDNFKEIARELNDQEARKLYYDTEGLYKDIQKVQSYISGTFASYFKQTIQSAHEHTTKISSQMNSLKGEGVDLVKEAEVLEKDDELPSKKIEAKTKSKPVQKGWLSGIGDWFSNIGSWFFNLLPKSVQAWFIKEEKKVEGVYDSVKKTVKHDYELTSDAIGKRVDDLHDEVQRAEHSVEDYFGYGSDDSKDASAKKTTTDHPVHPSTPPVVPPSNPPTDTHSDAAPVDHHDAAPTFKAPTTSAPTDHPVHPSTPPVVPPSSTPPTDHSAGPPKPAGPGRSITNHFKVPTPPTTLPAPTDHPAAPSFKPPTTPPTDHSTAAPKHDDASHSAAPPSPSAFAPPSFKPSK
jgi:hypothetical protein